MNWSIFHELTFGIGAGTFITLYLLILIKGIPEALKALKDD